MRKKGNSKNVFCLEGLWDENLKSNSSVQPVLELLHRQYPHIKYIHRDCATVTEFYFYISKWIQKRYDDYPVLYLAFHGEKKNIVLSDGNINFDELVDVLEGRCNNRIIVFSSCSTLNIDKSFIESFIKKTGCLAVCGYTNDVDWVKSVAFELILLESMQDNEFSGRGIGSISNRLGKLARTFPDLNFRMVTNGDIS